MAEPAADYHRGEMEIEEQSSTFHSFIGLTKWGSLGVAALVTFLSLWFCTGAGFLRAIIVAAVMVVAGIFVLRERKSADSAH